MDVKKKGYFIENKGKNTESFTWYNFIQRYKYLRRVTDAESKMDLAIWRI